MTIIQKSCSFLNILEPHIQKKVQILFKFGFTALSMQRIKSLNSNARITVQNTKTAESKIYRLSRNQRILQTFPVLPRALMLVKTDDLINVDFSDFNARQVLMFAKQTEQGRALPLYFEYITYPIKKDSQNTFIIEAIKHFMSHVNCTVRFVFDRGFACPSIIDFLAENSIIFYVRIKKDKLLKLSNNRKRKARELVKQDQRVYAYGHNLRIAISDKPDSDGEPWYIITNDMDSTRQDILHIYYHRFEVEEFFKDAKRLFGLEYISVKNDSTFRILLWFVMLGVWLSFYFNQFSQTSSRQRKWFKNGYHISVIAYWLEWINYEIRAPALAQIDFSP